VLLASANTKTDAGLYSSSIFLCVLWKREFNESLFKAWSLHCETLKADMSAKPQIYYAPTLQPEMPTLHHRLYQFNSPVSYTLLTQGTHWYSNMLTHWWTYTPPTQGNTLVPWHVNRDRIDKALSGYGSYDIADMWAQTISWNHGRCNLKGTPNALTLSRRLAAISVYL